MEQDSGRFGLLHVPIPKEPVSVDHSVQQVLDSER